MNMSVINRTFHANFLLSHSFRCSKYIHRHNSTPAPLKVNFSRYFRCIRPFSTQHAPVLSEFQKKGLSQHELALMPRIFSVFANRGGTIIHASDAQDIYEFGTRELQLSRATISKCIRKGKDLWKRKPVTEEHRKYIDEFVRSSGDRTRIEICHEVGKALDLSKKQIYDLVDNAISRMTRMPIEEHHREAVRSGVEKYLEGSDKADVNALCDVLQSEVSLPRMQLYDLIREEVGRRRQRRVTKEEHALIRDKLRAHGVFEPLKMAEFCDSLSVDISLPRRQLIALVHSEKLKLIRQLITSKHKSLIRSKVSSSTNHKQLTEICTTLEHDFETQGMSPLPRKLIYELLIHEMKKKYRGVVSPEQKHLVQHLIEPYVKEHHSGEWHHDTLPQSVYEQLEKVGIPRTLSYKLVESEILRLARAHVTEEQRKQVRRYISSLHTEQSSHSVPSICDALQESVQLPRKVLYGLVAQEMRGCEQTEVSDEVRETIREYVSQHPEEHTAIPRMCTALSEEGVQLPRTLLYKLLSDEVLRSQKSAVTEEQRTQIHEILLTHPNLHTYREVLPHLSALQQEWALPRVVLRHLVQNELQKVQRQRVTVEQRKQIASFVREQVILCNSKVEELPSVARMSDAFANAHLEVRGIHRGILREIIKQEVLKCR